ncbi:MAG: hypothetical protein UU48_C0002G0138 [Candidatus Uhrbacteria bacterium GW2011_GWF2_41_16]|uniref:Uncharacterized protein n=2 Tax=Candidatus Uhriibacteriota TaxID=1752732 RepID=A0A0G0VCK2_9BACT|nr:MAG: hypothetical protein UU31_C0003G0147 [Candidatus Uhrbacteria bacterium GW2011_GWA2_41_10]KKR87623.1 MAG: hypothetical protein UU35_C0002G0124 [Candidatus Uhrbacteria bacterium GW2011_GWC2_41_11]KKR98603.1 MAG: hypothetical protein UU48_C0002G0138 [Candidatus Uhrbacteria bacterium GW2011_GWF2_41_16]
MSGTPLIQKELEQGELFVIPDSDIKITFKGAGTMHMEDDTVISDAVFFLQHGSDVP